MSRLDEIKARLENVKSNNVTNIVQKEHEDIEFLLYHCEKLAEMVKSEHVWGARYRNAIMEIYHHEFSDNSYEEDWQDVKRIAKSALQGS